MTLTKTLRTKYKVIFCWLYLAEIEDVARTEILDNSIIDWDIASSTCCIFYTYCFLEDMLMDRRFGDLKLNEN